MRFVKALTRWMSRSDRSDLKRRFKYKACFEEASSRGSSKDSYSVR